LRLGLSTACILLERQAAAARKRGPQLTGNGPGGVLPALGAAIHAPPPPARHAGAR
jgi:hypothetical protein